MLKYHRISKCGCCRGFPPPVANLKRQIDASHPGLDKENPGSLWPKTSLGALKDDKRLTPDQLKALNAICERESVIFTAGQSCRPAFPFHLNAKSDP